MTWVRIQSKLDWNHRLTVTVPMSFLGIFDSLVSAGTLGFVQPSLALGWGFRRTLAMSRSRR